MINDKKNVSIIQKGLCSDIIVVQASYMKSMAPLRSHQYPAWGGAWLRSGAMSSERVKCRYKSC